MHIQVDNSATNWMAHSWIRRPWPWASCLLESWLSFRMGNILGRSDEDEEEAAEQKALERWRPEVAGQTVTVKKRLQTQHSHDDLGSQGDADNMSAASSVSQMEEEQDAAVEMEELDEEDQEAPGWRL